MTKLPTSLKVFAILLAVAIFLVMDIVRSIHLYSLEI